MMPKKQRIGILVIAVTMIVGTLGSFAMMILATENANTQIEEENRLYQEYLERQQRLSDKYYPILKEFEDRPNAFDAESVGEKVEYTELKVGDGDTINDESSYLAYYIGWNPDGDVFDSSFDGKRLKTPLQVTPGALVKGWYDGVKGMKIGGIREITIPAELGYGESGSGELIPPNTPIKFIVMAIPLEEADE